MPSSQTAKVVLLDDISFEYCGDEGIPDGSDLLSCDFEKDTCSWYHDYTASLLWKRRSGTFGDITGNGEDTTHKTTQRKKGIKTPFYLRVVNSRLVYECFVKLSI